MIRQPDKIPHPVADAAAFLENRRLYKPFHPPEGEAVLETLALAAGETVADQYAAWLRQSCSPR